MGLLYNILFICAGILLGIELLDKWDGGKDWFLKIEKILLPYNTVIGGAVFAISLMALFHKGNLLHEIITLLAGIILFSDVLKKAPLIGDTIVSISKKIIPFKATIGIATLVFGVLGILGF